MQFMLTRRLIRLSSSKKDTRKFEEISSHNHTYSSIPLRHQSQFDLNINNKKSSRSHLLVQSENRNYPVSFDCVRNFYRITRNIYKQLEISFYKYPQLDSNRTMENINGKQKLKTRIQHRLVSWPKYYASYYRQPKQHRKKTQNSVLKQKAEKQKNQIQSKQQKIDLGMKNSSINIISNESMNRYQYKDHLSGIDTRRKKRQQGIIIDFPLNLNFKDKNIKIEDRIFNFIDTLSRKITNQFYIYELYEPISDKSTHVTSNIQSSVQKQVNSIFQIQKAYFIELLQNSTFTNQMDSNKISHQGVEFYFKIIMKIKNQAINQYNINFYTLISQLSDIIDSKINFKDAYMVQLIQKLEKVHSYQQKKQEEKQRNLIIKNQASHLSEQKEKNSATNQITTKNGESPLNLKEKQQKLSILQLSLLLVHMNQVPEKYSSTLVSLMLKNISVINLTTLGAFLADCIVSKRSIQMQKLIELYKKVEDINLQFSLRYLYLLFVKYNMGQKIVPLYQVLGKVNRYDFQNFTLYQLYKYAKLVALQIEIVKKSLVYSQLSLITKKIITIDRIISENKYLISFNLALRVYNVIAKQYPLGINFISNYRQPLKFSKIYLPEYKKFILFQMVNFYPKFIYSIGERSLCQMNSNVMNIIDATIKFILSYDPKFLLEVSIFYQKYQSIYEKKNWTQTLENIFKSINVTQNSIKNLFINNSKLSDEKQESENLLKLINFIYNNSTQISLLKIKSCLIQICDKMLSLDIAVQYIEGDQSKIHIYQIEKQSWKFLFQLSSIINRIEKKVSKSQTLAKQDNFSESLDEKFREKDIKIIEKFAFPYIKNLQKKQKDTLLHKQMKCQQYLLRMVNILGKQYFLKKSENMQFAKQIIRFINNNFIYSVKSVIKRGIFQVLALFDTLTLIVNKNPEFAINPEINAYLYGNLSTFIIYVEKIKKLYINRGKNFEFDSEFEKLLISGIENYNALKNIQNKDRLNMLNILLQLFWKKMKPKSIAQYLIIIGDPILLDERLRNKLGSMVFVSEDIQDLDFKILSRYKLINESLRDLTNNYSGNHKAIFKNQKLNNERTSQEMKYLFQLNQFFQIAIQSEEFTMEHKIPEPSSASDNRTKMIYACLKIIYKIRRDRNFSIGAILNERGSSKKQAPIDLSQQINYIQRQNLIKLHDTNEFKLDNIEASGHNQMIQCWHYHQQSDKLVQISNFSTFNVSDINPYQKILLVVKGNTGLIRKLVKKQASREDVYLMVSQLGFEPVMVGSLIEVQMTRGKRKNQSEPELQSQLSNQIQETMNTMVNKKQIYLLCTNKIYHKIHLIYAYALSQVGYRVCVIDERDSIQDIKKVLLKQFERFQSKQENIIIQKISSEPN